MNSDKNICYHYHLASWIEDVVWDESAPIQSHLVGGVALIGASLLSLVEAVGRAVASCIALLGVVVTLGCCRCMRERFVEQLRQTAHALSAGFACFCSILSPQTLEDRLPKLPPAEETRPLQVPAKEDKPLRILSAEEITARNHRTIEDPEEIQKKLQTQFDRAQAQKDLESDGSFQYLSAPEGIPASVKTATVSGYEVGIFHAQGKRPQMEDEHLATSFDLIIGEKTYPVSLFGIFDGHEGKRASQFMKAHLEGKLKEVLERFCVEGVTEKAIRNALKIAFVELHEEFIKLKVISGTTATVAIIVDGNLWVANVGDSRTILDDGTQLSEDVELKDLYYRRGVEKRRGEIKGVKCQTDKGPIVVERIKDWDNSPRLAVGRTIGNYTFAGINPRPKITRMSLAEIPADSHLILACDGIYDVASTRQVASSVKAHRDLSAATLAKDIGYSAYQAGSGDNLSVLVVKLK